MKTIIIIILIIAAIIVCICCCPPMKHSEGLESFIQKKKEIEYGYSVISIIHSTGTYKTLDDSVALRIADNVYFVKRKDKTLGDWCYYRIE